MAKNKKTSVSLMMTPEQKEIFQGICAKHRYSMADVLMLYVDWLTKGAAENPRAVQVDPNSGLLRVGGLEELGDEAEEERSATTDQKRSSSHHHHK
jgi:hypothetical protein